MENEYYYELAEEEKQMLDAMSDAEEEGNIEELISEIIKDNKADIPLDITDEDQEIVISSSNEMNNLFKLQSMNMQKSKVKKLPKIFNINEVDKLLRKKKDN
ncbi:hypothetical protein H312_00993 [Anncaliia algerae PRA339]|uniref:Uncharacterized protein n=1 Tax=Anncaliia algerae PRA339 TaxID=1288291 RepID=A0A059F2Z4_9MICR|nr:hypothetical protein H312_00993 [Anncaliia algerae PRA339]